MVLLALVAATRSEGQPGAVARVTPTATGVRFSVEVPEPEFVDVDGFARLEIPGYETSAAPGEPALPVRIVHVAVPPAGEIQVRAGTAAPRVFAGKHLAPGVARIERGAPAEEHLIPDAAAYARPSRPPAARLLGVSWLRNQRVASIALSPVEYDPAGDRVTVASSVEVEVATAAARAPAGRPEDPDPFESVYRDLLVNYEQGRAWRGDPTAAGAAAALQADTSSVFIGHRWLKISIATTGFYRVTFGKVRTTALFGNDTSTPLDSLRLFTWPGLPVLPENTYCDTCDYREVAIAFVDKQGDAVFNDNEDYFYFFALGPSDWENRFDASLPDTNYLNHPYETRNYYYLTIATAEAPVPGAPVRIQVRDAAPVDGGGEITPSTFVERIHQEFDAEYFPDVTPVYPSPPSTYRWEKWFWRSIDPGRIFAESFEAPGVDSTQLARLRVRLWGISARDTCRDDPSRPDHLADVGWNRVALGRRAWSALRGVTIDTSLALLQTHDNEVQVGVPLIATCPSRIDRIGFAWFDVFYARRFQPVGDELAFTSPPAAGEYRFRVAPFAASAPPRAFDVTDPYRPIELSGFTYAPEPGGRALTFDAVQSGTRRYHVLPDAAIASVAQTDIVDAPATSLINLRSPERGADYLVIFYDGFQSAAQLLCAWRRDHHGFAADSIPVSALYDQFSGGRTDPAAIRNFLRAVYRNWSPRPTYVTMLGDASFDFKNLTGRAPAGQPGTLLPSYENGFDTVVLRQFATDDWILNVDNAAVVLPDFLGGRIPVDDAATALDVVRNKVILYEDQAPLGEYRNRVMFIADDNKQGAVQDDLGWDHLEYTSVVDSLYTPTHVDRVYVYLHTYPDGPGNTKPDAKRDIKQSIDDGITLFNYIGHGSPFKITDESVFLDTDVGTLANPTRLPVFVAASCDIGKFNDPTVQSLGERLIVTPGRGAIGVISATELALSYQNSRLNQTLYQQFFTRDASGLYNTTLSAALLAAKSGGQNAQKYQLMGDAAIRLNLPRLWTEVTIWDSAGSAPVTTLERGRTLTFRGRVLDRPGGNPVPLEGVAAMLIEDTQPRETAPPCAWCRRPPTYYFRAGPIFRGDVAMHGGVFEGRFVVPLEARAGARGRVRAYVRSGSMGDASGDGVGDLRAPVVAGTAPAGDVTGPRITLSFPTGSSAVRPDAVLRIDLSDPSGILITGHTPQNGIIVTVDGNTTNRVDVTSSFRYAADSYQSGTAMFQLPQLERGAHTIEVSAADNLASGLAVSQHRSKQSIEFQVVDQPPLQIVRAYLFPNPAASGGSRSGGRFVVDVPGDSVNVLLKLYTVSGRLIRNLTWLGGLGQVQIPWDGLDDEGAELANGVYLFKVHVNPRDADGKSSPRKRAELTGRFVIVNR